MSAESPEPPSIPLTFAWWETRSFPRLLPLFVILSLAANAATFFIFQVTNSQSVTIPAPAPRVSLLTPSTVENRAFLSWIAAEDPALTAGQAEAPAKGLASATYHPSFATVRTAARFLAQEESDTPFPPGKDPLEMIRAASAALHPPSKAPEPASPTAFLLSGSLANRVWAIPPTLKTVCAAPLENARFLLGVAPRGEIQFVFLQKPSGDSADARAADAAASSALGAAKLAPVPGSETAWGIASVLWGSAPYATATAEQKPERAESPRK